MNLYSYQQCMRVPVYQQLYQQSVLSNFGIFAILIGGKCEYFQNIVSRYWWKVQIRKICHIQPMASQFAGFPVCLLSPNFTIALWSETFSSERLNNLPKLTQLVSGGTCLWSPNHAHGAFILRWSRMCTVSPSTPPKSHLNLLLVALSITHLEEPLVEHTWHYQLLWPKRECRGPCWRLDSHVWLS